MTKKYLVKKNPDLPGSEDNWIIMTGYEFCRFIETEEGQRRKDCFERIDPAGEEDDILIMECDREKGRELKKYRNRADYLRRVEEELGIEFMSLNTPTGYAENEEEETFLDVLVDDLIDTEEMALHAIIMAELPAALAELEPMELDLILALYTGPKAMSAAGYAAEHGLTRWSVSEMHKRALRKLRLYYRRKKLL